MVGHGTSLQPTWVVIRSFGEKGEWDANTEVSIN